MLFPCHQANLQGASFPDLPLLDEPDAGTLSRREHGRDAGGTEAPESLPQLPDQVSSQPGANAAPPTITQPRLSRLV